LIDNLLQSKPLDEGVSLAARRAKDEIQNNNKSRDQLRQIAKQKLQEESWRKLTNLIAKHNLPTVSVVK